MNIEFDSEPVYGGNDKQIKAKIKSSGDKVNTNFQGKKTPKENASYKCLSLIMLDSVIRVCKKYYRQNSFKYFLVYNDGDFIRPLCITLPQIIRYVKHFDSNKTISYKVNNDMLLKKYTKIC